MADRKAAAAIPATIAVSPADITDHQAELDRRQSERDKQRAKHIRCLDPVVAAEYEHRKPLYEWKIECAIFQTATGRKNRPGMVKYSEQVVAQTESDAWAVFCDKIGKYPSRRDVSPRIVRLEKRSFDE